MTCRFQKDLLTVNLDAVSKRIQQGRLDTSSVITMQTLRDAGLIGKKVSSGVKLLGRVSLQSVHLILGHNTARIFKNKFSKAQTYGVLLQY
jgi:ribosomal protein L15